jgi:RNA polymerase sigma-70 factor (ECF subfamily)
MLRLYLCPPLAPRLARLYACDRDFVRHVLQGTGVPAVDIDDLVQDVFLVAWRRITDLDPLGPSRPWLFTIAQLVAANHKKRARHRHEVPQWSEDEARSRFPDPEENALVAARDAALRRSIHRLRPSLRAVLVLHDLDGLGLPDIAARLGISTKACGTRLTKARSALARRHDVRSLAARASALSPALAHVHRAPEGPRGGASHGQPAERRSQAQGPARRARGSPA